MSSANTAARLARYRCLTPLTSLAFKNPARLGVKQFSTSRARDMRTTEMTDGDLKGIKIDRERLWKDLHTTCEWGKGERWGE